VALRSRTPGPLWHPSSAYLMFTQAMAALASFSIVTFQRKPGHWRAAVTPNVRSGIFIRGRIVASFVTPDDSASEPDASDAAEQLIKAL